MATETSSDLFTCCVCGIEAAAPLTAECNWCDQRFHLNQRNDVEGTDCGEVWIDDQYLALQFACNTCLRGAASDSKPSLNSTTNLPSGAPSQRRRYKRRV